MRWTVAFLLVFATTVNAYDGVRISWKKGAPLPRARAGYAGGWINGKMIIAGGSYWPDPDTKVRVGRVDAYDPERNLWLSLPGLPHAMACCGGAMVGENFYVFGGFDGKTTYREVYRLDIGGKLEDEKTSARWMHVSEMPDPRILCGIATVGSRVYLIAGVPSTDALDKARESVAICDLSKTPPRWSKGAPFPGGPRFTMGATSVGNDVYVFGGARKEGEAVVNVADAWVYHTKTNQWERLPDPPLAARCWGVEKLDANRILIFGGYVDPKWGGFVPDVWLFDLRTKTYHKVSEMPAAFGVSKFWVIGNHVYVAGGENAPKSRTSDCWIGTIHKIPEEFVRPLLSNGNFLKNCVLPSGDWGVENGHLIQTSKREQPALLFFRDLWLRDVDLAAEFRVASHRGSVCAIDLIGRAKTTADYGCFRYDVRNDRVAFARAKPQSFWTEPKPFKGIDNAPGTWHRVRITVRNNKWTAYFDGARIGQIGREDLSEGVPGLGTCGAEVEFRNIRIFGVPGASHRVFQKGHQE